jgi:predicted permease
MTFEVAAIDVRNALRALIRARRVAPAAVVLTVALVLGLVTCVFSLVGGVFLQPLPFRHPDRLVTLRLVDRDGYERDLPFPLYADFSKARTFAGLAALRFESYGMRGREWIVVRAAVVTTNVFEVLDGPFVLGRRFVATDATSSEQPVVLSDAAWRRLFGADPSVVGHKIRLSDRVSEASQLFTIIGVTRASLASPDGPDVEIFIAEAQSEPSRWGWLTPNRYVIGRLAQGATPEAARAEVNGRVQQWKAELSAYDAAGISVEGLLERQVTVWRRRLYALLVAALFVLGLASANIGTLLLGVGRTRLREFATRIALGARRSDVVRQVLLENLILAILGGLGALCLVKLCLPALLALVPAEVPRVETVGLDWRVFAFALSTSAACGVLFGAMPAVVLSREAPQHFMRGPVGSPGRTILWTEGLLSLQFALALGLTTGCALSVVSEWRLAHAPIGFATQNLLVAEMRVGRRIATVEEYGRFQEMALAATRSLPEISDAAIVNVAPPTSIGLRILMVGGQRKVFLERVVSGGYFRVLGIPLLFGRTLREGERAAGLAVVNLTFATRWFGRADVVGESFFFGSEPLRIIGVVQDSREWSIRESPRPTLYRFCGIGWSGPRQLVQNLIVKTRFVTGHTPSTLREQLRRIDADMPVTTYPLESKLSKDRAETRFYTRLLLLFASFTVAVAAVGIAGNVHQTISRRRREISIRLAIGANLRRVQLLLIRRLLVACAAGLAAGILAARLAGSLLQAALYEVGPADPATFTAATLVLLTITAAAAYGPIRTINGTDLNSVLRSE